MRVQVDTNEIPKGASSARVAQALVDKRAEALVQRMLQKELDTSQRVKDLQAISRMQRGEMPTVAQLVLKKGPDDHDVNVTLIEDYMPNFLDAVVSGDENFYCINDPEEWNDTDYFYDGKDGKLVQATIAMVNTYWDPKYEGFERHGGPARKVNCEDYAKAGGIGGKKGEYDSADSARLGDLLSANGKYVVKLSHHWLKVEKTGEDAITISQKDGESAVYSKSFTKEAAILYICNKTPNNGIVYEG